MANFIENYANEKSMATPGAAGLIIMFIANTINYQFELGNMNTRILVMILSFLAGSIVFKNESKINFTRFALYVFNSLFIFCMATGSNSIGNKFINGGANSLDTISIEPISNYIKPVTPVFFKTSIFQDTLKQKTQDRKQILHQDAIEISNNIQDIQKELREGNHQKNAEYNVKLSELAKINEELSKVNKAASKKEIITYQDYRNYQNQINIINDKVKTFQNSLNENSQAQKRFFSDW